MNRDILKYTGGFLLCILMNALVNGLAFDLGLFKVNPQTHIPIPTSRIPLMSVWYSLVVIVLYGAWSLYVLPLLIFHVSAKYVKFSDYGSFVFLSALIWFLLGLIFSTMFNSPGLVLSYSIVGLTYGYYYKRYLYDQSKTE